MVNSQPTAGGGPGVNVWLVMDSRNHYPSPWAVCLTKEIAERHAAKFKKELGVQEMFVSIEEWGVEDS
jgi:hypothetical protein